VSRCRPERLGLVLGLALSLALWAVSAGAEVTPGARVFLDYTRDARARTCLSPDGLARAVETRLGRPVFVEAAAQADLVARVRARRVGRRFVVDVAMFARDHAALGGRQLVTRAPHCSSLDDSLALVLSLAADAPLPQPTAPEPPRAPDPPAPAALVPEPPPATPIEIPATTHAPRLGFRLEPSLGVGLLVGPLPAPAPGIELGVTLRTARFWPVSLRAGGWWPQTHRAGVERGARFSGQSLEVGVCPWQGSLGPFSVLGCVREWFGRISARGFGFDEDQRSERWAVALGAGANLEHWFGPVLLSVDGSLLVPPVRRRYFFADVAETTTLHDEPWLFGSAGVRLGTQF
jgi:hypothetical protein